MPAGLYIKKLQLIFTLPMQKLLIILLLLSSSSYAQNTWLPDSSFSEDGIFKFSSTKNGHAVLIQPDNKIIIGGNTNNVNLIRLHPDGTIDSTFGLYGLASWSNPVLNNLVVTEMALQEDGKILVVGYSQYYDEFIVRFTANGNVDTSFNGGTMIIYSDDYEYYYAFDTEVLSDGKILTAGLYYTGSFFGAITEMFLVQLNMDGSYDTTFSSDGKHFLTALPSEHNVVRGMSIQTDGKILLAGYYMAGSFPDSTDEYLEIVRLNPDLSLDTLFHQTGYFRSKINGANCRLMDVNTTVEGKILCAGYGWDDSKYFSFLMQFNADGNLDETFGEEGIWISPDTSEFIFRKLAIQNDKIFVTGEFKLSGLNSAVPIMGFDLQGVPLNDFGINGLMTTNLSTKQEIGYDIAIQSDNKIVVTGIYKLGLNQNELFTLRLLPEAINDSIPLQVDNTVITIYPNPVQSFTITVDMELGRSGNVNLDLLDITGKTCAHLINDTYFEEGSTTFQLSLPETLSSGQYILQLTTAEYHFTNMLIIL